MDSLTIRDFNAQQKYEIVHMKENNDVDRIKAFFRKYYPTIAKEWSDQNEWSKCPVQKRTVTRWRT